MSSQSRTPLDILQQYWGYDAFRPAQEGIIQSVMEGKDTLALLPTGGGKSICYQVPALCMPGICIVVSPLIALMQDQVRNLRERGIAAVAVYAGMSRRELDIIFENACNGAYKLLYISPERLKTDLAVARIKRMQVNLIAVDEAHCVSQWGYDFRPPYLELTALRDLLPGVPFLALTATATPEVVEDIQEKLGFKVKNVFRQPFERPNLSYSVLYEAKKKEKMLDILRKVGGSGIVYVRSRGETKEIAQYLSQNKVPADFYHAGLEMDDRRKKQEAWIKGHPRIMVATNAFGMGIDKPDVRAVVHLQLPDGLEAYFQEAGRAGRDGKKAFSVVLYTPSDADTLRFHFNAAFPPFEQVKRVYQALGSWTQLAIGAGEGESYDFDFQLFCQNYKLEQAPAHAALKLLEQEGWIALSDAVSSPAKVHITASREALYDYQLRNKQADTVTKVLLRAYPGIQLAPTDISELAAAKYAKLPYEVVFQVLEKAHKEGILDYQPKKDKPQLTFLRERVATENLTIDNARFQFRKQRAEERVERAIRYAEQRKCRSKMLLEYFGVPSSTNCGICDVCTGRNEADADTKTYEAMAPKILQVLRHEALTMEQILEAFSPKRHEKVVTAVSYMLDEGVLKLNAEGLFSPSARGGS